MLSLVCAVLLQAASEDRVPQWLDALTRDSSFKVRLQAAVKLGRSHDKRAMRGLIDALHDEHYTVRGAACLGLGNLAFADAVPSLLQSAATDEDTYVRTEARNALGLFDKESAWPHVLQASNTSDVEVRREAIATMAKWQDDRARLRMIEALGDNERIVRIVEDALAALGTDAKMELLRLGLDSPKASVRVRAAQMLGTLQTQKAVEILMDAYDQEIESDELRRVMRDQLRQNKKLLPEAVLFSDSKKGGERFARARALKFLGVLGSEKAIDVLVEALRDEDIYVRGVAALSLAEAGDPRAIPALSKLVEDQDNARIVQIVRNSIQILERRRQ